MGIRQAYTLAVASSLADSVIMVQVGEMSKLPETLEKSHLLWAPPMFIRVKFSGPELVGSLNIGR